MNNFPDDKSPDGAPDVARRTIVQGAAWTVPIIAATAASPFAAASNVPCPVLPRSTSWALNQNASGIVWNNNFQANAANNNFGNSGDAYPGTGNASVTASTTMNVVAGTTYTFTFSTLQSTPIQQWTIFQFAVNGSTRWEGVTRPGYPQSYMPPNVLQTHTVSWTATTTGSIPIRYTWLMGDPNGYNPPHNDDIFATVPTVTCRR